jgi:hypothetical protein
MPFTRYSLSRLIKWQEEKNATNTIIYRAANFQVKSKYSSNVVRRHSGCIQFRV